MGLHTFEVLGRTCCGVREGRYHLHCKGEGAQIIQLFGRGVRLKGYDLSLKRSGKTRLPEGVERPRHIGVLETLGIFGIHADYMAQFRDFLDEEGLAHQR